MFEEPVGVARPLLVECEHDQTPYRDSHCRGLHNSSSLCGPRWAIGEWRVLECEWSGVECSAHARTEFYDRRRRAAEVDRGHVARDGRGQAILRALQDRGERDGRRGLEGRWYA